jgi:hypothetical protein
MVGDLRSTQMQRDPQRPRLTCALPYSLQRTFETTVFHGGKLMNEQTDPDRNRKLTQHSRVVLAAALPILPEVRHNYWTT